MKREAPNARQRGPEPPALNYGDGITGSSRRPRPRRERGRIRRSLTVQIWSLRRSPQIPDSGPREALHPPYTPRLGRDAVILLRRPGPSRGLEAIFDNRCIFERRCGPYCKLVDARLGVWGAWAQTVATWSAAHTGTQQRDSNKTYGERCCRISSQKHRFFENRGFGRWLGCHFDGIARHCSGKLEGQPGDSGRGLEWDYGWSKSRIRQVPIHNTSHPPKPRSSLTTDFVTGCGVESRHANQWCENHSGWWTRGGRHRGYGDGGSTPSHLTKKRGVPTRLSPTQPE